MQFPIWIFSEPVCAIDVARFEQLKLLLHILLCYRFHVRAIVQNDDGLPDPLLQFTITACD